MRFDVITLFPELFELATRHGVTGRAVKKGRVTLALWNPRDYTHDRHRTVDARPYGGGAAAGQSRGHPPLAIEAGLGSHLAGAARFIAGACAHARATGPAR